MFLKNIKITNYKNCDTADIDFSHKINCFVGNNGMGKTNLLDAIFYLSLCKSYFNYADTQNIRYGEEYFTLQGYYERAPGKEEIFCAVSKEKKKIFKRNGKEYERLSDHIGLLPVVIISPYDTMLITEGSEERRKLLNTIISQYNKEYLHDIMRYNKALIQRNKLLKDLAEKKNKDIEILQVYDEQLIHYGEKIHAVRNDFIEKFTSVFSHYYKLISGNKEVVELNYLSPLHKGNYRQQLQDARIKDLAVQFTTIGIHKDDLQMHIAGYPIKNSGSQGQQKTFLVSLKFAQFDFIKHISGVKPILLMDDIFDKFDNTRITEIIRLVANDNFGQIFISDTNQEHLMQILKHISFENSIFFVENGHPKLLPI